MKSTQVFPQRVILNMLTNLRTSKTTYIIENRVIKMLIIIYYTLTIALFHIYKIVIIRIMPETGINLTVIIYNDV